MIIKQLSIFIENHAGKLAEVTELLGKNDFNISALSVADTKEFGILRLIVANPEKAYKLLKDNGYSVSLTEVICIVISHTPGALSKTLKIIGNANLSVEYMYAFEVGQKATVVLKVDDPQKTIEVLKENKLEILKASEVYQI